MYWCGGVQILSKKATQLINSNLEVEGSILISSISTWEVAMLVANNRLILSMDIDSWLNEVARIPAVEFVPLDNAVAVKSTQLPGEFHKDPAHRTIVSLARHLSLELITADEKIIQYPHVKTVW